VPLTAWEGSVNSLSQWEFYRCVVENEPPDGTGRWVLPSICAADVQVREGVQVGRVVQSEPPVAEFSHLLVPGEVVECGSPSGRRRESGGAGLRAPGGGLGRVGVEGGVELS